jgi:hypothetical protein
LAISEGVKYSTSNRLSKIFLRYSEVFIIVIPDIIIVHGVGDITTDTMVGDILIMDMDIMEVTGTDITMVIIMVIGMDTMMVYMPEDTIITIITIILTMA